MLLSALEHYRRQRRIAAIGLAGARRELSRGNLDRLVAIVTAAQLSAATDGADSVPLMLSEQDIPDDPSGSVIPEVFAGVASDGRDLRSLMSVMSSPTMTPGRFERVVVTQISDAGRGASSVAIASRPTITGYTRMLVPPSCSRCAILAGKFYRWNTGFQRHPHCDCRHIPATENTAGNLTTDPSAYFDGLTREQQDAAFTKAGAQAIRDGADMSQVVNARRGMSTAQVGGRKLLVTSEGTTRRGVGYKAMKARGKAGVGSDYRNPGERYFRTRSVRPMPESIYEMADDRADAIRLLRLYGYLT